jgi:cold shock CspA family protein
MPHGVITRVEPDLGFGWIVDDSGMDWFFVGGGVRDDALAHLREGRRVTFSVEWTATGPRATDITLEIPQQVR